MGGYGPTVAASIIDRANEIHADNKQKKDEEHARTISDLILQRQDLVNKIPTLTQGTPEYDEAHKQLQGVIGDIRDVYHPQKNPGAIEKFGHLLTDSLKITNPQDRAKKQSEEHEARTASNAAATDRAITAAPLSAAQLDVQKKQAELEAIEKSDLDDEGKKAARAKVFGVVTTVKPNFQQFKNPNGTISYYDLNKPDDIPDGASAIPKGADTIAKESIAGWQAAVAQGYTGSLPEWVAEQRRKGSPLASMKYYNDYAMSHGFKGGWNDIPAEYRQKANDYAIRKQALDKAYPVSTTVTSKALDAEGQFRLVTVTNYKTPQGTETLEDPLWFLAPKAPGPNDGVKRTDAQTAATPTAANGTTPPPSASPSTTATNPKELRKEADARNPNKPTGTSPTPSAGSSGKGGARVSEPLFPGQNKEYNDAKQTYDAAVVRQKQMHTYLKDAEKPGGNQQAQLGLLFNHIGMTQGAQKGARINQTSVDEAKRSAPFIDTWIAQLFHQDTNGDYIYDGPKGGINLTDEQMKQMVELADEGVVAFRDNVKRIQDRIYKGASVKPPGVDGGDTKKTVKMKAPNGFTKDVPEDQVQHYKDLGAVEVKAK